MTTKIDLEDDNVFFASITVEQARALLDGSEIEEVDDAVDQAQGHVFGDEGDKAYVVIEVTK